MSSKREVISSFRKKLQERNADSTFFNRDLYDALMEQAKWLIRREIAAGRIYTNNSFFQTLGCVEVIETSTIDKCCPIKVNCKIYRTKDKLPEMWVDTNGPVIKSVTSVDGTTDWMLVSPQAWQNKRNDPYQKMAGAKYAFFADNYIWFPEHNPHRVNIVGFYMDDISDLSACAEKEQECIKYLDTEFMLPGWLEAEMFAKALQTMIPTKQMQEDEQIDKNPTRKS